MIVLVQFTSCTINLHDVSTCESSYRDTDCYLHLCHTCIYNVHCSCAIIHVYSGTSTHCVIWILAFVPIVVILCKTTLEFRTPLQSGQLDGYQWCPQYRGSTVLLIYWGCYWGCYVTMFVGRMWRKGLYTRRLLTLLSTRHIGLRYRTHHQ